MKIFLITIILLVSIFLETTLIALPFLLLALLAIAVVFRSYAIFVVGFIAGVIIDSLLMRPVGITSLFYVAFLCIIFLYQECFELRTISFVLMMSFFGSFWYLIFFGHQLLFLQIPVSMLVAAGFFYLFSFLNPAPKKKEVGEW